MTDAAQDFAPKSIKNGAPRIERIEAPKITVEKAIEFFGGDRKAMCAALGVGESAISNWKTEGGGYLPKFRAMQVRQLILEKASIALKALQQNEP